MGYSNFSTKSGRKFSDHGPGVAYLVDHKQSAVNCKRWGALTETERCNVPCGIILGDTEVHSQNYNHWVTLIVMTTPSEHPLLLSSCREVALLYPHRYHKRCTRCL